MDIQDKREDSLKVKPPKVMKLGLLILSCAFSFSGITGGPLLLKLYFVHGGGKKWLSSWLQTSGFPVMIIPLAILYFRRDPSLPKTEFFASRKLLFYASLIGIVQGINNVMYSYGLSFLPVSTSALLYTTQLVFTSFVSFVWIKQKFTPYSINAIAVIILGSVLLGITRSSDRPPGVTNSQYLLGFFLSIASAAIIAVILVGTQVAFAKANQAMTYPIALQFQVCLCFFATVSCTIGGLINKDFMELEKEASEFDLGTRTYYFVLVSNMVVWQLLFIGRMGTIFCSSSLFAGVVSATILPFSQIAAVLTFHENFSGEKGMALALTLWGFASYFYGSYR
ncbi:hypothetical protein MKW94_002043 [Papaver nudicaule]|uniref:Probable purine permease n=1 Tax=Papaver nudicaule TaxID=74823 RepID=A0AA41VST7_PAPNU|nr:hypothetical protein [Papaver nudicaule]